MKVLTAGWPTRPGDFADDIIPGELCYPGGYICQGRVFHAAAPCPTPNGCRCAAAFTGCMSGKPTSVAVVTELDTDPATYTAVVQAAMAGRWPTPLTPDDLLHLTADWPTGTEVRRDDNAITPCN